MSPTFRRLSPMPVPADDLYAWHARPGAFERLTPPFEDVRVASQIDALEDGQRVELSIGVGPVRQRWTSRLEDVQPGRQFVDVQTSGPFASWRHEHRFVPATGGASTMHDEIQYRLPLEPMSTIAAGWHVEGKLDRLFRYRHDTLGADLALHSQLELSPMRVAITGSSGLLGTDLRHLLTTGGHTVHRIVRRADQRGRGDVLWKPREGVVEGLDNLEGVDAIVHLAGENIAAGRWTRDRKRRIRDSRVQGTESLVQAISRLARKPRVMVCASAIGIYGDNGDQWLDEDSASGAGFLADVGRELEEAALEAEQYGVRVVLARFGIILSPKGGALAKMLPAFRAGVAGRLGPGNQYMSWVGIDDAAAALLHAIAHDDIRGPMNVTAPNPVTNAEFTRVLARILGRFVGPPAPALALHMVFGEMADEALLSSTRVRPKILKETGYGFRHPDLEQALRHVLGRGKEK